MFSGACQIVCYLMQQISQLYCYNVHKKFVWLFLNRPIVVNKEQLCSEYCEVRRHRNIGLCLLMQHIQIVIILQLNKNIMIPHLKF